MNNGIVSFIINYRGTIRDLSFNIKSRVTSVQAKVNGEWKLIHKYWSRFPKHDRSYRKNAKVISISVICMILD
jgi:hypothetical protein